MVNVVEMWEFDATSRAYSRPILHLTIQRCSLLRKLYKALFWLEILRKGIDWEGVVDKILCPFWAISNAGLNYLNMPSPGAFLDKFTPDIDFLDEAVV